MAQSDSALFVRVVEAGSLKAVAEELRVNPSTISRRLAAVEERLGVRLLQRSTRRTTATDAGLRYYEGMRRLLDAERSLEAEISGVADVPTGRLRVAAPVDFGALFVVPAVERLAREAPALEIDLVLGSGFVDLPAQDIDVAVRIGRLIDSALRARRLGGVPRVLVASPEYLARRGEPRRMAELAEHEFVFYVRRNAAQEMTVGSGDDGFTFVPRGRVAANSMRAIRSLLLAGHGIALGPRWAHADDIAAGRLVALLPEVELPVYPLHAVYRPSPYQPAKVRRFIEVLEAHVQTAPGLVGRARVP